MAPDDEQVLVARLSAGDTGAFDEVYDLHRPWVFGFLLRMTRNRALAEDLLDETWLRLVRHATRLLPDTRLGPWLFTVARNDRDDKPDDDVLASLARLRTCDVSQRRSRQLRRRCHAVLQAPPSVTRVSWMRDGAFRRHIVPALGAAWCLAYLVEIVRCTAAICGYFGAP